jgi:stearoyl-CoA desaturase (Delta-9 desaturase)
MANVWPDPGEFDTKGKFQPVTAVVLMALQLAALAVVAFKIIPWAVPRFVPGMALLFSHPLQALAIPWHNEIFVLSFICFVGPKFGIALAFHRGETHGSFKWDRWWQMPIRLFFVIMGHLAFQADLIGWAARHRPHHAYTDQRADSHTPFRYTRINRKGYEVPSWRGFWYAHQWTYSYHQDLPPAPCANTQEARAAVWNTTQQQRHQYWVGDLEADPILRLLRKLAIPLLIARFAIPAAIGGWDGFLIAGVFTAAFLLNITWCTNSVAHMDKFGTYINEAWARKVAGTSRNVFFWLFLWIFNTESWHHWHHLMQVCAAHGQKWWQFDFTKYLIGLLQGLGLVYDVKWKRKTRKQILANNQEVSSFSLPDITPVA